MKYAWLLFKGIFVKHARKRIERIERLVMKGVFKYYKILNNDKTNIDEKGYAIKKILMKLH